MNVEEPGDSGLSGHLLVVDDEPFIRNAFKLYLETHGFKVSSAAGGDQALEMFRDETNPVDVILLDLVLPGFQGLELLRRFKMEQSLVEVIIATGCGSMNSAIEALRLGAFDYITKPIVDFDRDLLSVVTKALANRRARLEQISAARNLAEKSPNESGRFYGDMESLAANLSHSSTPESAWAVVASFFEQHFGTTGGVVSEHSAESMSFSHGWGAFREGDDGDFAPPDTTEVDFWRPLLRSTSRWEEINSSVLLPPPRQPNVEEEILEVMRIPLDPARVANGRSTSLFVVRPRHENAAAPPAQTALLALIVNAALSRSVVAQPA